MARLAYGLGLFQGVSTRADVIAEIKTKGVTAEEIEALWNVTRSIALKVFYS